MAFANTSVSDIIATTIQSRSNVVFDNCTDNNGLLAYLKKNKRIRFITGGDVIRETISFGSNGNFAWYSGYDAMQMAASDNISAAEYSLKQCAAPVLISGREMLQNSGPEAQLDLLEERLGVGEATMYNNMSTAVYSDGTGSGGNTLLGLQGAIVDTPTTGTIGGIDRSLTANVFWRNQQTDPGSSIVAATIHAAMNTAYNSCVRGPDHPDLIVTTSTWFGVYESSLQTLQRFSDTKTANLGFETYRFKGADVILDGGINGACPAGIMYMLNTKYISLRPHKDRNMVPLKKRTAFNQDAEASIIAWAGALTYSGMEFHAHVDFS